MTIQHCVSERNKHVLIILHCEGVLLESNQATDTAKKNHCLSLVYKVLTDYADDMSCAVSFTLFIAPAPEIHTSGMEDTIAAYVLRKRSHPTTHE